MKEIFFIFMVICAITATGCTTTENPQIKPIGTGSLNQCKNNVSLAESPRAMEISLFTSPGNTSEQPGPVTILRIPACEDYPATVWNYTSVGNERWVYITARMADGRSYDGWLPVKYLTKFTDKSGTEWSERYSSIVGRWDRTDRGNGPKIWYEFTRDGNYTLNYDMMGNRDNVQDQGSWVYLGNGTWDLISNTAPDHRHISITVEPGTSMFTSGSVTDAGSGEETKAAYKKSS